MKKCVSFKNLLREREGWQRWSDDFSKICAIGSLRLNCHLNGSCQTTQPDISWKKNQQRNKYYLLLGKLNRKKSSPILEYSSLKYFHQNNESTFHTFSSSSSQTENCNWPSKYFILIVRKSWISILIAIYLFFIEIKLTFTNHILYQKNELFIADMNSELWS